jgi:hypothetical protein
MVFPDESNKQVEIGADYQEATAWDHRGKRWRSAIRVTVTEVATNSTAGTHARLELFRHQDLEQYSHSQLEALIGGRRWRS